MSTQDIESQASSGPSSNTANSDTQTTNTTNSSSSNAINPPLFKLKILDALKNNNYDQLKQIVLSVKDSVNYYELSLVKNLIFNLAVQVAPLQIIQRLLSDEARELAIDVNYQDENGNAPLHLAAINSRYDVAQLLLRDERINDTILNNDLKQPIEVAKDLKIVSLLQKERALYVEKVANELRQSFTNHDFARLDEILSSSRNFELLDINGNDPETGDTVLHEFVKKNDIGMVKWILSHGGDPFRRDNKGKLPIELVSKNNETMKKIIKDASQDQNVISSTSGRTVSGTMKAPTFKGYLRKWTNFASGYKLRWFILDSNGILSYYKSQEDTMNACRGSLNMKSALLHLDSSEKQKFEIISKSGVRWHLKGNHPIETNRWVWSLQGSIRFAKDKERAVQQQRLSSETDRKQSFDIENSRHNSNISAVSDGPPSRVSTQVNSLAEIKENERLKQANPAASSTSTKSAGLDRRPSEIVYNSDDEDNDDGFDQESREIGLPDENEDIDVDSGPYIQEISVLKRGFSLELGSLKELLKSVQTTLDHDSEPLNISLGAIETLNESFEKLNTLVLKRDERLIRDLQKQKDINELWINSIRDLENELLAKNNELQTFETERRTLKKALTRKFSSASASLQGSISTPSSEVAQSPFDTQGVKSGTTGTTHGTKNHGPSPLGFGVAGAVAGAAAKVDAAIGAPSKSQEGAPAGATSTSIDDELDPTTKVDEQIQPASEATQGSFDHNDAEISRFLNEEEDSDDEFFDAADFDEEVEDSSDGLASTQPTDSTAATTPQPSGTEEDSEQAAKAAGEAVEVSTGVDDSQLSNELQKQKNLVLANEGSYKGYEFEPRKELDLKVDNRPKVGLWGILKSMIGKDMTKISLPVFFNEPTSLLQRVAEDLEYSELLNQAASFEDSTLRLLYVAAFAASEYGSTTNRVAKPFNPLLGETYEYARPDLGFRFITEQVSHHPPVSAALAEAIKWDYYGETSVKSAFNGRSFDVQPLGNWYLHLRPDCEKDEEIYSWKKLSTSVVGIVVGNPSIDNYGEMIITNSKTGDKAVLNFKPRGWRGASAYEMSGVIYNSKGEKEWSIGGHWNNRIFAKKVIKNNTSIDYSGKKIGNVPTEDGQKFLMWQTAPRPQVPFNLTSYAITLNEDHPDLVPFLSRGDTRLRPDQRAMENGHYEDASNFKNDVEVKQRVARKQREEQGIKYEPAYFTKEVHPVTKEEYWKYNGDYWKLRNEGKLKEIDIF